MIVVTILYKSNSTMLHTTKSELRERSSNTNAYVMLVDLEALFASKSEL
jgi:hypothetical protein